MKKLLLGTVGLVALGVAPVSAADLAARPYTKAPPMVAPVYDWSGFYIGGNAGWGNSRNRWNAVAPDGTFVGDEGRSNADGAIVGGQIGYRWQANQWVFGIEAQGDWADLKGSNVSPFSGFTDRSKLDAFGLFTGQIGYAWNNVLVYVKGGGAVVDNRYEVLDVPGGTVFGSSGDKTNWGGTVGAGLEYGFAPNWSVGVEYDHIFLQDKTTDFTIPGTGIFLGSDRIRQDVDLVAARINYRFGGPVIAKY
ncbi:outer membrane beta-barrel protein [Bradyrhizobium sp. dw_78]|uniref:outer membrane protein n=1 Tax=Bradyrhizobium sp. dw_78 TaxID=2719793 RepID=UPI001BD4E2B4|nr:outer membrane beta-barrel protein [Bradyrhizobium sp. dw_78]